MGLEIESLSLAFKQTSLPYFLREVCLIHASRKLLIAFL